MNSTYVYSASQNIFLMNNWKEAYISAGTWPDDLVEVSDAVFDEFSVQMRDKVRIAGVDGMPAWADMPPPTADEIIKAATAKKQALISEAAQFIAPLKDALDGGYIDDEGKPKLTEWQKYRYYLTKVDPAKPVWPEKPAE